MQVRILQWNVWFKEDPHHLLRVLREVDADILCLQELIQHHTDRNIDVARFLGDALHIHVLHQPAHRWNLPRGWRSIGEGIFSKFPLRSHRWAYVQDPLPNARTAHEEGRIYLEATIDLPQAAPLTVATTHLSVWPGLRKSKRSVAEMQRLLAEVRRHDERYVFAGDLNLRPHSWLVRELRRSLRPAGPPLSVPTWTTKTIDYLPFEANQLNWRIDYMFTSQDVRVRSAQALDVAASDHRPILVECEV